MANGKYLPADNPQRINRDLSVATLTAKGYSQHEVANKLGISQPRVNQLLSDDKVRQLLQDTVRVYASHAKGIRKQFIKLCYSDDEGIQSKNIAEWHKIMGIAPVHTSSVYITQIIGQQTIVSNPTVLAALSHVLDAQLSGIAVEPIDVVPVHDADDEPVSD